MKITSVRYRRLRSHDRGYGHDAIEAEVQVPPDEFASDALQRLKTWVIERLEEGAEAERLTRDLDQIRREVRSLQHERDQIRERVTLGREVMSRFDRLGDLAEQAGLTDALTALEAAGVADRVPF